MKKIILFLVLVWLLPCSGLCREGHLFADTEFKLGYQGMHMDYDEPGIMDEKGMLHGGFFSWTGYSARNRFMFSAEVEALTGSMDYTGQYSDGTGLTCGTDDRFISLRILAGKGFDFGGTGVTPFTGVGARYWYDQINAPGGYERKIKQVYLPLGVRLFHPAGRWNFGGTLEGDLLVRGRVESALSQAGAGYSDAKNTQELMSGIGAGISMFIEYEVNACILGLEPYIRYWRFDRSEPDTILWAGGSGRVAEPENRFHLAGIRFYLKF